MGETHQVTVVRHRVGPGLAGLVAGMVGMSERAAGTVTRRQPAGSLLPLVFSFGNPLHVTDLSDGAGGGCSYGSFLSGLSTGHARTQFQDSQDCVQVYLPPIAVGAVLGVPGIEVARRLTPVGEILPLREDDLAERLGSATTWDERFSLVEAALRQHRGLRCVEPPAWVSWMWQRICSTGGQVRIRDLVAQTGWSHRHATSVFEQHVGLTPKQAANVVRFERASLDLGRLPIAEVAARHGYADQSHLTRAVARHAGETPQELAAARRPTPSTALGTTHPRTR